MSSTYTSLYVYIHVAFMYLHISYNYLHICIVFMDLLYIYMFMPHYCICHIYPACTSSVTSHAPIRTHPTNFHVLEIGETLHGGLHKAVHILLEGFVGHWRVHGEQDSENHAGCSWYILMYKMKQYDIV